MKRPLLYRFAFVLLAMCVSFVVWQESFRLKQFDPSNPTQTLILWAISILIFLLMVTLGWVLVRTGLKLYIERQANQAGSRIKTKLVVGALALSILPVCFLVWFSYSVLNINMKAWFTRPAEDELQIFVQVGEQLKKEMQDETSAQAALLASTPQVRALIERGEPAAGFLERFCREQELASAAVYAASGDAPLDAWGPPESIGKERQAASRAAGRREIKPGPRDSESPLSVTARSPVADGPKVIGYVGLSARIPLDMARTQAEMERISKDRLQLLGQRRTIRAESINFMVLITLFVLSVATWIALFLAKQISVPIAALLEGAGEVRKGNLRHRVNVRAVDELGSLVRSFNQMTQELEAGNRELDARRRFTEAILESIPTGVISIGSDGSIRRVNRALSKIFPATQVSLATRLEDLFSREDTAEIKYLMKRARRTGAASRQIELRTAQRKLQIAVTVSALEEKLTSGFVVVLEDTTELLRAQKAAAWHEVARRVAHEIKNPLTPMGLSAERIVRQIERLDLPPGPARIVGECAAMIAKSVESVKTLVDEFSQFARFPSAQPARSDLNEVVSGALAVFEGRLDGIQLRADLAPGLPPVNLDREQFQRVVVNLVDNAAEAMQDSLVKELHITTQPGAAETVELVVEDTGCGIGPEEKERLFLPYFSTKNRGTGLGLAIVSHIVAEHNGQIRVEDNQPVGARFTVELPAIVEADAAEGAGARPLAAKP
jgi:PAS domain S-box-containing protein